MPDTKVMPSLFVGHGSPMNLVLKNEYTESFGGLGRLGRSLPRPEAVCVVSRAGRRVAQKFAVPKPCGRFATSSASPRSKLRGRQHIDFEGVFDTFNSLLESAFVSGGGPLHKLISQYF